MLSSFMFVYMCTRLFHSRFASNAIHFRTLHFLLVLYVVNISSLSCISYKYIHTYVCMNVRWLNCLQRIRLVTHYENISGLSVQLLKTGQQVVFNLLRTLCSPLSSIPKTTKVIIIAGQRLINRVWKFNKRCLMKFWIVKIIRCVFPCPK